MNLGMWTRVLLCVCAVFSAFDRSIAVGNKQRVSTKIPPVVGTTSQHSFSVGSINMYALVNYKSDPKKNQPLYMIKSTGTKSTGIMNIFRKQKLKQNVETWGKDDLIEPRGWRQPQRSREGGIEGCVHHHCRQDEGEAS